MKAIDMPTLIKEIRTRMRGKAAPVMMGLFVTIASIVVMIIISNSNWDYSGDLGKNTFISISITEMFLIAFIGPTLCSNVITLERERQTLDFLLITRLSPWNILMGKYLGAAGYLILLWMSIIPITAVAFILGGVSWLDFILMQVFLILLVLLCSAIGVYASSRAPKSNTAASQAIGLVVFTFYAHIGIVTAVVALPGLYRDMLRYKNTNMDSTIPEYLFILLFLLASMALSYIPSSVVLGIVTFFQKRPAKLLTQISIFAIITLTVMGGMLYINNVINPPLTSPVAAMSYQRQLATAPAPSVVSHPSPIDSFIESMDSEKATALLLIGNPAMTAILLLDPYPSRNLLFSNIHYDLALSLFLMLLYTFTVLSLAYGNLLRLYPQFAQEKKRKKIKVGKGKGKKATMEEVVS